MHPILVFILGMSAAPGLACIVVLLVKNPLFRVLKDLCGGDDRAQWWMVFSSVFVVLMTLAAAMWRSPDSVRTDDLTKLFYEFLPAFRAGLLGLLGSLIALALIIVAFLAMEQRSRR